MKGKKLYNIGILVINCQKINESNNDKAQKK